MKPSETKTMGANQTLMGLMAENLEQLIETARRHGVPPDSALIIRFTDEDHDIVCVDDDTACRIAHADGVQLAHAYTLTKVSAVLTGGTPCICVYVGEKADVFASGCTLLYLN